MDLKPTPRQTAPQAPLVEPTPPAPAEDPFKPDHLPSAAEKKHHKGKFFKKFMVFIVVLALLGGTGYGTYYWQHQQVDKFAKQVQGLMHHNSEMDAELTTLTAENKKLTNAAAAVKVPTTDELVIAAVTNYCNANVDATTKKPLVVKIGAAGTAQKQVLYSTDKNFAYVNAVCSKDGTTEGSGTAYYLKKVNSTWVFLYRGQAVSPEYTTQFNIPTEFK